MSNQSSSPSGKPDYAPRPAWVKWLAIALGVLLLVVVVVALLAGGEHGPSRHMPGATIPGGRVVAAAPGFGA